MYYNDPMMNAKELLAMIGLGALLLGIIGLVIRSAVHGSTAPPRSPTPPLRRYRVDGVDVATGIAASQWVAAYSMDHAAEVARSAGMTVKAVAEDAAAM